MRPRDGILANLIKYNQKANEEKELPGDKKPEDKVREHAYRLSHKDVKHIDGGNIICLDCERKGRDLYKNLCDKFLDREEES